MINQEAQPNGSMGAFARAFSNLVKDATSHLATKDDLANMAAKDDLANMATKDDLANMATKDDINKLSDRIDEVEQTVAEGYKRIYSWRDEMYKTFVRKEDLKPSAFKEPH